MHRFYRTCLLSFFMILFGATVSLGAETVHIVKPGDSLWSIAQHNGVTVDQLKQVNGLSSNNLQIGQRIAVNYQITPATASVTAGSGIYIVKSGDSLWAIARNYNMTVAQLKQLNGLVSDSLKVGQKLKTGSNVKISSNVNTTPAPAATPSRSGGSTDAARIVEYAAKYIGTPYAYGGQSPSGFDCSGFVGYVFAQFGYSLPRVAADQYTYGVAVAAGNLEAGDLLFFTCGSSNINHVGIYCGNNRFIHSSSPSSGGVIYSSLQEGYYANCYAGAKRIIR
ncbi:MAG TPA: peptidoglycan endopeptidase [Syntrophomonas sp.]|nr:peptidoglycan endopeptidase [Syntrophomonas sp.]HCF71699.1 peptidoglycan endopeptidase [Syntrophomonas sp.]